MNPGQEERQSELAAARPSLDQLLTWSIQARVATDTVSVPAGTTRGDNLSTQYRCRCRQHADTQWSSAAPYEQETPRQQRHGSSAADLRWQRLRLDRRRGDIVCLARRADGGRLQC